MVYVCAAFFAYYASECKLKKMLVPVFNQSNGPKFESHSQNVSFFMLAPRKHVIVYLNINVFAWRTYFKILAHFYCLNPLAYPAAS